MWRRSWKSHCVWPKRLCAEFCRPCYCTLEFQNLHRLQSKPKHSFVYQNFALWKTLSKPKITKQIDVIPFSAPSCTGCCWLLFRLTMGERKLGIPEVKIEITAQPEAWLHGKWRVGWDPTNFKDGGWISFRSISNNSSVLAVVHDQLNKQCHREENTYGLSLSRDCFNGSSAFYSAIFVANTSYMERCSHEIFTEIQSS